MTHPIQPIITYRRIPQKHYLHNGLTNTNFIYHCIREAWPEDHVLVHYYVSFMTICYDYVVCCA